MRHSAAPRFVFLCLGLAGTATCQTPAVIEFVKDAAWCWFQDERAVVDTLRGKLVIGTTNMGAGVDVTIVDLATRKVESKKAFAKLSSPDDHNSPALLVGPNGEYVAMWAHHYDKYNSHYSIHDGTSWSAQKAFDWSRIPGGTNYTIAYSNLHYLASQKRMFNFARANERAPNFLYSDDGGKTWEFGGQLTTNSSSSYNKGYYKYWSDGIDRIDMVFTEQHPRDFTTSIYHGYFQGGKTYSSEGTVADADVYERTSIPTFEAFTKVFADGTRVNGATMGRAWQSDLVRYPDGTIAILFQARANDDKNDHRNFYARFDGKTWKTTYLGKAGGPMYASEEDYTGLAALSPDAPDRIYVSSPHDPGNDASLPGKREIWRGTTRDHGATWTWEAVTRNSAVDNFRPIVPRWKPGHEALLWFRGTYRTAQNFTTDVVGILSEDSTVPGSGIGGRGSRNAAISVRSGSVREGRITLRFRDPIEEDVEVELVSTAGRNVARSSRQVLEPGTSHLDFPIGSQAPGLYLCRVRAGALVHTIPVSLLP